MTDIDAGSFAMSKAIARSSTFAVEDVFWGYKIQSGMKPSLGVVLGQLLSFFFGVCFATAALGIVFLPAMFFDGDLNAVRIGAAALFGAFSAYLLWFSNLGIRPEAHVDVSFAEIREVALNRTGKAYTVGRYPFDAIGGVFLEQTGADTQVQLIVRCSHTSNAVLIATGTEAQLTPLRDRLARDILKKA